LVVCILELGFRAAPASAATTFPAIGSGGDAHFNDNCPAGQYVVGFKGRVGGWIDQIQLVCAPLLSDGSRGQTFTYVEPPRGGLGGAAQEFHCDAGFFSAILVGMMEDNRQVKGVVGHCLSLHGGQKIEWVDFEGKGTANDPIRQECPPGEMATGINGNYGKHLNAIGLICNAIVRPPAPVQVTTPLPPVHHYNGPPRHTGTPAQFAGTWKTDTDLGGHFFLALSVNGNQASGTFTNNGGDPKYNGTLTGTVNGNQLRYTYLQPAVNGKGSGFFVFINGGKGTADDGITGAGVADDAAHTKFKWTGRRTDERPRAAEAARGSTPAGQASEAARGFRRPR
jgi:hypothetical protein